MAAWPRTLGCGVIFSTSGLAGDLGDDLSPFPPPLFDEPLRDSGRLCAVTNVCGLSFSLSFCSSPGPAASWPRALDLVDSSLATPVPEPDGLKYTRNDVDGMSSKYTSVMSLSGILFSAGISFSMSGYSSSLRSGKTSNHSPGSASHKMYNQLVAVLLKKGNLSSSGAFPAVPRFVCAMLPQSTAQIDCIVGVKVNM
jgi:hypothetical protein